MFLFQSGDVGSVQYTLSCHPARLRPSKVTNSGSKGNDYRPSPHWFLCLQGTSASPFRSEILTELSAALNILSGDSFIPGESHSALVTEQTSLMFALPARTALPSLRSQVGHANWSALQLHSYHR